MNRKWMLAGGSAIAVVLAGIGVWQGVEHWSGDRTGKQIATAVPAQGDAALDRGSTAEDVVTIGVDSRNDPNEGATPMKDRVAVLGVLNKRNGETREITLKPGEARRLDDIVVRLRACERTAPWEPEAYTGAFVQLDVNRSDHWTRVFSGWLYKEQPSLNVVIDPIYDVWPKSCAMTFPDSGRATESVPASRPAPASEPSESSAENEAGDSSPDAAPPSAPAEPSAAESNET